MAQEKLSVLDVEARKRELKNKKLKRREITDQLLKEVLDEMSIEERYGMLYYYIMNDVSTKADS